VFTSNVAPVADLSFAASVGGIAGLRPNFHGRADSPTATLGSAAVAEKALAFVVVSVRVSLYDTVSDCNRQESPPIADSSTPERRAHTSVEIPWEIKPFAIEERFDIFGHHAAYDFRKPFQHKSHRQQSIYFARLYRC
jgi:hypothetical protein